MASSNIKKEKVATYLIIGVSEDQYSFVYYEMSASPKLLVCMLFNKAGFNKKKLLSFLSDNKIKPIKTTIILGAHAYRLLTIDAPDLPEDEARQAAKWLVKDLIKQPLIEVVVDAFPIPGRTGQKDKLYVVVASIKELQVLYLLCKKATLHLNEITIGEFGLLPLLPLSEWAHGLLYTDRKHAYVMIVRNRLIELIRPVNVLMFEGRFPEEAYTNIVLEVQRSLDFYQTQKWVRVETLFYLPISPFDKRLISRLREELHLTLKCLDQPNIVEAFEDERWGEHIMDFGLIEGRAAQLSDSGEENEARN